MATTKSKTSGSKMPAKNDSETTSLDSGPNVGERGEYKPARYKTNKGNVREDR